MLACLQDGPHGALPPALMLLCSCFRIISGWFYLTRGPGKNDALSALRLGHRQLRGFPLACLLLDHWLWGKLAVMSWGHLSMHRSTWWETEASSHQPMSERDLRSMSSSLITSPDDSPRRYLDRSLLRDPGSDPPAKPPNSWASETERIKGHCHGNGVRVTILINNCCILWLVCCLSTV